MEIPEKFDHKQLIKYDNLSLVISISGDRRFMEKRREFFAHVTAANLTGEQLRVLCCLLANESDCDISIRQNEVAATLGLTESNVSRAIRALKEAGVLSKKDANGRDGKPVLRIDQSFDFGPVDPAYLSN